LKKRQKEEMVILRRRTRELRNQLHIEVFFFLYKKGVKTKRLSEVSKLFCFFGPLLLSTPMCVRVAFGLLLPHFSVWEMQRGRIEFA
jgi:hypothetical protein